MGNCVGGFKRRTTRIAPWKRNRPIVLCFLGIDGAGKTTIVKALQGEDLGTVHTTVGFSRAEMRIRKYRVTAYDLGGSARIREIWPIYFAELYGIVYVVDASAASRLQENKQMVDSLTGAPDLQGKPILFLLNKKDLPEAVDEMQFSERFNLHGMAKQNKTDIRVEGVCAVKGTGKEIDQVIVEGVEWLIEKVLDNYENIAKGVEQAVKQLKDRQARERLERQHRLAMAATEESPKEGTSPVDEAEQQQTEDVEDGTAPTDGDEAGGRMRQNGDGNLEEHKEEDEQQVNISTTSGGVNYRVFEIEQNGEGRRDGAGGGRTMTEGGGGGEGIGMRPSSSIAEHEHNKQGRS